MIVSANRLLEPQKGVSRASVAPDVIHPNRQRRDLGLDSPATYCFFGSGPKGLETGGIPSETELRRLCLARWCGSLFYAVHTKIASLLPYSPSHGHKPPRNRYFIPCLYRVITTHSEYRDFVDLPFAANRVVDPLFSVYLFLALTPRRYPAYHVTVNIPYSKPIEATYLLPTR